MTLHIRIYSILAFIALVFAAAQSHSFADTPAAGKSDDDFTLLQTGDFLMAATDIDYQKTDDLCHVVMDSLYFLATHHTTAKKLQFTIHVNGGPGGDAAEHKAVFLIDDLSTVRKYTNAAEYQKSDYYKEVRAKLVTAGL